LKVKFLTLSGPEFWVFVKGECQEFSVKAVKVFIFCAASFLYETRLPSVSAAWIKHQLKLNVEAEM
jgi:hypothetical protein